MFSNHRKIILREYIPVLLNEGLLVVFESSILWYVVKNLLVFYQILY